ncbi:MAG: hypothetical protein HYY22_09625 [Thaumarchaeota archaeon]|nr:hypothetical protein [Nitrososphaerota archaeon]
MLFIVIFAVCATTLVMVATFSVPVQANQNNSSQVDPMKDLDPCYKYREFPYSDFTFNGFEFKYSVGQCLNPPSDEVDLLPCGSRLSIKYPHYEGWRDFSPTRLAKSSLKVVDGYQKASIGVAIMDGAYDSVTLDVTITENNTRTVFIGTKSSGSINEPSIAPTLITITVVAVLIAILIIVMRRPLPKISRANEQEAPSTNGDMKLFDQR